MVASGILPEALSGFVKFHPQPAVRFAFPLGAGMYITDLNS